MTTPNHTWATDPALRPWRTLELTQPAPTSPLRPTTSPPPDPAAVPGATEDLPTSPSAQDQEKLSANPDASSSLPPPGRPPATEPSRPWQPASAVHQPPPGIASPTRHAPTAGRPLTAHDLITHRRARPTHGWRALLYSASGGFCNPGLSTTDAERRRLIDIIRTPLPGLHHIAVSSLKGGIGKTTVAACLGMALAEYRGDRIIALDANPDAGTLADRLTGHVGLTIRDLIENIETIRSWTDLAHYTSLAGRLQVLASEQDPAMSEAFNGEEYQLVVTKLAEFNNVIITDSGTGLVHSAMGAALEAADTLVIVGAPTLDGATRASKTLDWLDAHNYGHLVERALIALSHDRASRHIDHNAIREHFTGRCHTVIDIPPDPHLAIGGPINLDELRPRTRDAFLQLAAAAAEQFSWHTPGTPAPQTSRELERTEK